MCSCAQSCLFFLRPDLIDWTLPGCSVKGISQARILESVAIFFFRGSYKTSDWTPVSCFSWWQVGSLPVDPEGSLKEQVRISKCWIKEFSSVQFSHSVVSNSLWPLDCSTPGLPVHHQLPEFTQTHIHWVGDTIQPFHLLLSHSPPTFNLSQQQDLFQRVSSLHQVAKILEFQLPLQSFQWIFRTDFL